MAVKLGAEPAITLSVPSMPLVLAPVLGGCVDTCGCALVLLAAV
jgi:hypothetical protein